MQGGRRVIVGVTGSVGNLEALRSAAAEARRREAALVAVHAWVPPGGDLAERRWSVPELRQVWQDAAWRRLWDAFDAALGGLPAELPMEPVVMRGDAGRILVRTASREDDLLVVGAGRRGFSRGCCAAGYAATAWATRPAPSSSCRRVSWPRKWNIACTPGSSGTGPCCPAGTS